MVMSRPTWASAIAILAAANRHSASTRPDKPSKRFPVTFGIAPRIFDRHVFNALASSAAISLTCFVSASAPHDRDGNKKWKTPPSIVSPGRILLGAFFCHAFLTKSPGE